MTAGLGILIYAIVGTETYPWDSARTIVLLAVAAVVLAVFAVIEMRLARAPLVPFDVFRSRPVSGATAVMFLIGAAILLDVVLPVALPAERAGLAGARPRRPVVPGYQSQRRPGLCLCRGQQRRTA